MSRKDYEMLAAAIHAANTSAISQDEKSGISLVSVHLARALSQNNPRFNYAMWLAACRGE